LISFSGVLIYLLSISESDSPYSAKPVSAILAWSASINANNDFLTYKDDTIGIRIDYPAGWIHELHARGLVTFLASSEGNSNTYPAGLGIVIQQLRSKNIPLNEITKIQMKSLSQSHSDLRLIESSELMIAGNIANKIVFTATDDMKHQRKAMQIWTVSGDKAYLITYKAEPGQYSKYLPTIQKMIDSFQFIK
jgi:serine/threonine-protein kinase